MAGSSEGMQGHDIVPKEIARNFGRLFADFLPGWAVAREYNYTAAASTQRAALQLETLLHSGSHSWINDNLTKMLERLEGLSDAEKTVRLGALVNYLHAAVDPANLS